MKSYPKFKAAACHSAPIYFDVEATISKACSLIGEAARNGAALIAFPEAYICAFPVWSGLRSPVENHEFFTQMAKSTIEVDGPEMDQIRAAARQHGIVVSMGLNEGTRQSVGCIWDTNVIIGGDGTILNRHRKLVPTFWEKLTWANGDGSGLRVVDSSVGRIGALVCGENTNPLARYALMAQGEQVHISSYPPIWPTRPPEEDGAYDLKRAIEIRAGAHAFEAKVFNIVASGFVDAAMREAMGSMGKASLDVMDNSPRGISMVLDPTSQVVGEVLGEHEGILYAEIDTARCVEPKQFHDVVGYYNRFDVFHLEVDRSAREPAYFSEGAAIARAAEDGALDPTADMLFADGAA